jgi:UDP-glucose 4-epimerase
MKKIIIFGATGTIGAYAALYLKGKGYAVIAVGKRKCDNGFFAENGMTYYSVDITNQRDFEILKDERVDAVIHCAGMLPARMSGYAPQIYIDSILHGTFNILEYIRTIKCQKIVFMQTRADSTYLMGSLIPIPSDIEKKFPLKSDHSVYCICKNAAVDLVEHYYHLYNIRRFILRLPTIYAFHPDPYYFVNGEKKIMAYRYILERAIRGEKIEIWGDPTKRKEIVYVDDLLQIIEKCIISELNGGMYNVGCGGGVSLDQQIKGIIDVFSREGRKSEIVYCPNKPSARQFVHDISKTQAELGYNPQFDYLGLLHSFKKEMEEERMAKLWGYKADYLLEEIQ